MKFDIHNPYHKKVPSAYTILLAERPTFPDIFISVTDFKKVGKSGFQI